MIKIVNKLIVITLFMVFQPLAVADDPPSAKLKFWDIQRKGANGDGGANRGEDTNPERWFQAASSAGLEYVRLIPHLWPGEGRDFLLGNADNFSEIPAKDLALLKSVLDTAYRHNVKILLTMFSLPGARTRQDNDNEFDYRLWNDEKFQRQAIQFWTDLAGAIKDHPAIVAYNPLNEPHPGREHKLYDKGEVEFSRWLKKIANTPADLNRFNRRIVEAIRKVDKATPIVLDGWMHSSIEGLKNIQPVRDKAVLYAFHTYGPWIYATYRINKGRFSYPDAMPVSSGQDGAETVAWTKNNIERDVQAVILWANKHNIPANRIIAEEFGADRRVGGATAFLSDTIDTLNKHHWHWAFYSFRSASWDGMDYELGTKKLPWAYWQKREKGISHEKLINRKDTPVWNVFKKEFTRHDKNTCC